MSKIRELALDKVIRARGFEDKVTRRFAEILEGNYLCDCEIEYATKLAIEMPFDEE